MARKPCAEPGCPIIGDTTRCVEHARMRDKARGSSSARGYGDAHQALRAGYQRRMDQGEKFSCWRCGDPIDPQRWHLGHDDHDRTVYRGPECTPCNLATRGRTPGG